MSALRLFTDEDIYGAVTPALRRQAVDAISTAEADCHGQSDEDQLDRATRESRALVTFNVGHFTALHAKWMSEGRRHAGIIVSSQRPVGEVIRRLFHLANALDAEAMRDRLEFLGDW